jgi:hypothetical protein
MKIRYFIQTLGQHRCQGTAIALSGTSQALLIEHLLKHSALPTVGMQSNRAH